MTRKKSQLLVNRYPEGISPGGKIVCLPCIPAGVDELEFYKDEYFKFLDERETFMLDKNTKIETLLKHVVKLETRLDTGLKRYKKLVKKHNKLVEKYNSEHQKLVKLDKEFYNLSNQHKSLGSLYNALKKKYQYLLDNAVFTKPSVSVH